MKISDLKYPSELKKCSVQELNELCEEIRTFLIRNIAATGGHLSSNLGIVELTVALHTVFDSPSDKFIFDVGHQSYVHKILTGRASRFSTLRQYEGLSGFQKRCESEHDVWEAGHSSTALSAALGFSLARDLNHESYQVVPIVGDASMMSGMSLEALNTIGMKQTKMVIILNDNGMSISKNTGALTDTFTRMRTSRSYNHLKSDLKGVLNKNAYHVLKNVKDAVKRNLIESSFFGDFNLDYLGPVNGHDMNALLQTLSVAKNHNGPIVVHVVTKKGKGYKYAEEDTTGKWHGISAFNIQTGEVLSKLPENVISWSQYMSDLACEMAGIDPDIVAITPAMTSGSKLEGFAQKYPKRFFDCGIAEDHASVLAASLAISGKKPFLAIYSSFLQRAYDQMNHELARMDLPVVVAIDRAGLVGEDGATHHGVYDIQLLRALPNFILAQPSDASEAKALLKLAFHSPHPFALRYPRGNVDISNAVDKEIRIGEWERIQIMDEIKCRVIAYGPDVHLIVQKARSNQLPIEVINARFFKPLDTNLLDEISCSDIPVIIYETDMKAGGLSSAILEYVNDRGYLKCFERIGIANHFVLHGSLPQLRKSEKIDLLALFEKIGEHL